MPQLTENEVNVFKIGRATKGRAYLALLVGLAIFGVVVFLERDLKLTLLFCGAFLAFVAGMGYFILSLQRSRVEVHGTEIHIHGVFQVKVIPLDTLRGFRMVRSRHSRRLELIPKAAPGKPERITLHNEPPEKLAAILERKLPNLDRVELEASLRELFQCSCLGATPEAKATALRRLRWVCRLANYVAMGIGVWAILFPRPYAAAIWTLLAVPLAGLWFMKRFEGAVRFYPRGRHLFLKVDGLFIFPTLALVIRAALDWHIVEWSPVCAPFAVLLIGGGVFCFSVARELRQNARCAVLFSLILAGYAFGATATLNGLLAHSPALAYHPQVIDKHSEKEQMITVCYLTVSAWGSRAAENKVLVEEDVFRRVKPGDTVELQVRTGRFGIPFYTVH